jgi:hypothetical protein
MNYSNNPQAAYNGLISGQRNMFLSSSVAVVMIGFSSKFKAKYVRVILKGLSSFIFFISLYIGYLAERDFKHYLEKNPDLPDYIPVDKWKNWIHISYMYCIILIIVSLFFLFTNVIN